MRAIIVSILFLTIVLGCQQRTAEEYFKSGDSHFDKEEYEEAIADFTKVIELIPKDTNAYFLRGLSKKS